MRIALSSLVLVFGGCVAKVDEDNYAEKLSEAFCKINKECSAGSFYDEWDDIEDCTDDLLDQAEDNEDFYDDCDFDDEKAQDCLAALNEVSCQDYSDSFEDALEDCAEIWDCGDAGGGGDGYGYGYDSGSSIPG
jgi:hypothetical protein